MARLQFADSGARNHRMFIFLDMETTGKESDDRLCQLAIKTKNVFLDVKKHNKIKKL
jgi:hypothetical protein